MTHLLILYGPLCIVVNNCGLSLLGYSLSGRMLFQLLKSTKGTGQVQSGHHLIEMQLVV